MSNSITNEQTTNNRISFKLEVEIVPGCIGAAVTVHEIENSSHYDPSLDLIEESSARIEYLHRYLADELSEIARQFTLHEWAVFQAFCCGDDSGARMRKTVIKEILKRTDARLRKRLPSKGGGRPSSKNSYSFVFEKRAFAEECFSALSVIEMRGEKLTRTNLAAELFDPKHYGYPEKTLTQRMKKFNLTMGQLLGSFRGTGPERVSLMDEELAQTDRIAKCRYFEE